MSLTSTSGLEQACQLNLVFKNNKGIFLEQLVLQWALNNAK